MTFTDSTSILRSALRQLDIGEPMRRVFHAVYVAGDALVVEMGWPPNPPTKADGRFRFEFAGLPPLASEAAALAYVRSCLALVLLHELDESLRVDGELRWDPHGGRQLFRWEAVRAWAATSRACGERS